MTTYLLLPVFDERSDLTLARRARQLLYGLEPQRRQRLEVPLFTLS